jgi:DNA invertase Pin-like site-specific DNA recombinase
MSLVGCARVSTEDQATDAKVDALTAGGSAVIFREHMSGAKASRPELLKALGKIQRGDMLVMATLDRLARSLSHLLSVIAELDAKGGHFKSLADPIYTTTPQGRFASQVLGAVAELERVLIQERTKDGLRAAKRRGRVGGNPKLRAGDRDAIQRITEARRQSYFDRINRRQGNAAGSSLGGCRAGARRRTKPSRRRRPAPLERRNAAPRDKTCRPGRSGRSKFVASGVTKYRQ